MALICPSILAADFGRFQEEIQQVTECGADWIHIDVMDGHFVPPITFGTHVVEVAKRSTTLPLDVHLMIEKPELHIGAFADAGADIITVHAEVCPHLHRITQMIRERGVKVGVAINPATPLSAVEPILPELDLLLIMTVNPGWGGQKFLPLSERKIQEARERITTTNKPIHLEVDGGITAETAKLATRAGADALVAGTAIFRTPDYRASINALR